MKDARQARVIGSRVSGRGWLMTFGDLLNNDQLILVVCDDCSGRTPLDPAPYALRNGVDADIAQLAQDIRCPVCGSAEITLRAHSPVERRVESPAMAK